MKAFWNDRGRGPDAETPVPVELEQAGRLWTDQVRGIEGNFFGLVDDQDRTIQFYYAEGIANHVDDAEHLSIIDMDLPVPAKGGSYVRRVRVGDVLGLIERAFTVGVDPEKFDAEFRAW